MLLLSLSEKRPKAEKITRIHSKKRWVIQKRRSQTRQGRNLRVLIQKSIQNRWFMESKARFIKILFFFSDWEVNKSNLWNRRSEEEYWNPKDLKRKLTVSSNLSEWFVLSIRWIGVWHDSLLRFFVRSIDRDRVLTFFPLFPNWDCSGFVWLAEEGKGGWVWLFVSFRRMMEIKYWRKPRVWVWLEIRTRKGKQNVVVDAYKEEKSASGKKQPGTSGFWLRWPASSKWDCNENDSSAVQSRGWNECG